MELDTSPSSDQQELSTYVDISRTNLQQAFFQTFSFQDPLDLLAAVRRSHIDTASMSRSQDFLSNDYRGWLYWFMFTKGYTQFIDHDLLAKGNQYYEFLTKYFIGVVLDPFVQQILSEPARAEQLVHRRLLDFATIGDTQVTDMSLADAISPVKVIIGEAAAPSPLLVYEANTGRTFEGHWVDGWHRLFAAKLWRRPVLRLNVTAEASATIPLLGVVERLITDGASVTVQGWILDPRELVESVGIQFQGETRGVSRFYHRQDVEETYPHVDHAGFSGFTIENVPAFVIRDPLLGSVKVLALRNGMPFGHINIGNPSITVIEKHSGGQDSH